MQSEFTSGPQMVPHSRENEEALISACLINPDAMSTISLESKDFYIHRNGWIWDVLHRAEGGGRAELDRLILFQSLQQMRPRVILLTCRK